MDNSAQSELESFRQQWRQEVAQKSKKQTTATPSNAPKPGRSTTGRPLKKNPPASFSTPAQPVPSVADDVDGASQIYHDLDDKEQLLKLRNDAPGARGKGKEPEPRTALEHYERAVEKETQGSLGDSVNLYRKAFKMDAKVHEAYKTKHFPTSASVIKTTHPNPSLASVTVSNPAHYSLDGSKQETPAPKQDIVPLIHDFSKLMIPPAEPETDISEPPPCPIAEVPYEILVEILHAVAAKDVASLGRLARVCKRFAYLVMTEDRVWKRVVHSYEFGFPAMHYSYACDLRGHSLTGHTFNLPPTPSMPLFRDLTPTTYPTYRSQFRHRPRLRFNGCYISTVNYARPGASNQSRFTWVSPVTIVTYYRYLRFFRDGSCISLLTTSEPSDVIHHLTFENLHNHHSGGLPSSVMKDALRGRWRLSGPPPSSSISDIDTPEEDLIRGPGEYTIEPLTAADEPEGEVHVETEGVIPKYMWKMQFTMGNAGRRDGARNGKLTWKGFWSYNRLTDDWGEFGLKNDRAFYYSRVKSYGNGL